MSESEIPYSTALTAHLHAHHPKVLMDLGPESDEVMRLYHTQAHIAVPRPDHDHSGEEQWAFGMQSQP
ncbi:MAG: hypothetical protein ABR532_08425 [Candidatus Dormibacteria bacterium]